MANGVAYTFDTHDFVKRLIAAGLPEAAAETLADEQSRLIEKMASNAASKEDLKEYKSAFKEDFKHLEDRLDAKFSAVDSKFDVLRSDITWIKWILGVLATGIFVPLLKGMFQ